MKRALLASTLVTCLYAASFAADTETTPPAVPPPISISPLTAGQGDPKVLLPMIADTVPWAAGDRILIVGDQLASSSQPELALRVHDALVGGRPGKDIVVRSLQNQGLPFDQWLPALLAEWAARPPRIIVFMPGVGDVLAAQASKGTPATPETWRLGLVDIMKMAHSNGTIIILATPAIVGDKPAGGPNAVELDAYADMIRIVAKETQAELCDLRTALLAVLTERNGKGAREIGILSKSPGQLKPEGMDLVAGLLAKSIAIAVAKIPWSLQVIGGPFTGTVQVEIKTTRTTLEQVTIYYTTDGAEPTEKSRVYSKPFSLSTTAEVKVLAIAKTGGAKQTANAWFMEIRKHDAETVSGEHVPGLWVDHYTLKKWRDPIPPFDTMRPDFETWWPNCELAVISKIPVHRYPNTNYGLRFTGYFCAPLDGVYVFATRSDDASRLTIGDVPVIRNDDMHPLQLAQGAINLTKGFHSFTLLYGQGPTLSGLEVMVSLPGQRLQPLPDLLLRRPLQKPPRKGISFEAADEATLDPEKVPETVK